MSFRILYKYGDTKRPAFGVKAISPATATLDSDNVWTDATGGLDLPGPKAVVFLCRPGTLP